MQDAGWREDEERQTAGHSDTCVAQGGGAQPGDVGARAL